MKLPLDGFQQIKNYIHAFQGILLFLAIVLTIATFGRDGQCGGSLCSLGWYMALCWLTVPILIYLVMVPMWSRARKFSNVYAFAVLDGLAILLWLTAWASTASYVASGAGKGKKKDASGCNNFKYGSPGRCKLSTSITILGVFMMLAFCATACVSFRAVMHYKRTGMMPNAPMGKNDFSVQTQDDFSSNINNDEFDDVHGQSTDPRQGYGYQQQHADEEYAPVYQNDHDDLAQPATQPISPPGQHGLGLNDYDTSYHGSNIAPDHDPRYGHSAPPYGR